MKFVLDTHTHTIASGHAHSTIQETAAAAAEKGLELIAITEHGSAMAGAPVPMYFTSMFVLPGTISGVKILRGTEANIVDYEGGLDLSERVLKSLDFVMAGFHDVVLPPGGDVAANTRAMVAAIRNPLVDAISHPGNPAFQIDVDEVVRAAKDCGKLLEINNNSAKVRKGSFENCVRIAAACAAAAIPVVCGSDTHYSGGVGEFESAVEILESAVFPEELVLNTSVEKLMKHLNALRPRERRF